MRLSKNFTSGELIRSDTAKSLGIINTPNEEQLRNLGALVQNVLQPLREILNKPIIVTSGFRCKELNKILGGSPTSQHCEGKAVDIIVSNMSTKELYNIIKQSKLTYDQLILEVTSSSQWVHISYNKKFNRKQNLIYKNNVYTKD